MFLWRNTYHGCDFMTIDIKNTEIEFNYVTQGTDEIYQNLKVLFSTPSGSVALDRNFGIDWSILDKSIEIAKGLLTVEYIEKVNKYESRAEVEKVTYYNDDVNGYLIPKVVIKVVTT